ncbi:MAG: CBS domain-containing protein [Planctomycetaceae bacterium]|nr:CBS domain-containing protein [Planctomycetaceae bacterium]
MICPHCGHDNIPGVDACEVCGQPLSGLDLTTSELERAITEHPVRALVPKKPLTVSGETTVSDAIDAMVQHRIGCLLVEQDGQITGIFTERDVLNRILPDRTNLFSPVSDFMTVSPETISRTDSIAYAMHCMSVGGYRHLPVAGSQGDAIGMISARDLLRYLSIRFADIRDDS